MMMARIRAFWRWLFRKDIPVYSFILDDGSIRNFRVKNLLKAVRLAERANLSWRYISDGFSEGEIRKHIASGIAIGGYSYDGDAYKGNSSKRTVYEA